MNLKSALKGRPVIYEIVPPRRDTSRYQTELRGVESVLQDGRVNAINIPELMVRRETRGRVHYSPTTIPPEDYALMIKDYKDPVVNIIAPRLPAEELLVRARRILHDFKIRNLVLVGKERREDTLPGPSVVEALRLVASEDAEATLGGICIFDRVTPAGGAYAGSPRLTEAARVLAKAEAGCDFVTSQIVLDPAPALRFLADYREACNTSGSDPLTVFISLTTIPTASILSLIEGLDVVVPPKVRRRLSGKRMGPESVNVAAEIFQEILSESEGRRDEIPLGLQIEQVGVNSGGLSMELLDRTFSVL